MGATRAVKESKLGHGSPSGQFLLDDLRCSGTEVSVFDCPHGGLNNHDCGSGEWAGVGVGVPRPAPPLSC